MTAPAPYGLVAIAGSAGALGALREILSALPADYPLPVVGYECPAPAARSAFRMTATSMASCSSAPTVGGM